MTRRIRREEKVSTRYNNIFPILTRLGLATTWIYAGVFEKLLNPGYLNPASTSYVGVTIQVLLQGPLMRGFLESVVLPHVYLVGILVMIAEICFGVLTLTGTMSRFVNTVAFYQNLIYFLSAYWADTEEYGINLLMMILDLYIVFNGVAGPSVDSLIGKKWGKINDWKIWFFIGSIFYLAVVIYLYIT